MTKTASQQLHELAEVAPMSAGTRTKVHALADAVAALEHDLERSMANHVADINAVEPTCESDLIQAWECSCGAINRIDNRRCHHCNDAREKL